MNVFIQKQAITSYLRVNHNRRKSICRMLNAPDTVSLGEEIANITYTIHINKLSFFIGNTRKKIIKKNITAIKEQCRRILRWQKYVCKQ